MDKVISEILTWVLAVGHHTETLVTGGVVTALLTALQYKRQKSIPWALARRVFAGFLFVAFFLAWRDQYEEAQKVPILLRQAADQTKQIAVLNERPPQVQVNLPAPEVKFPPQMAYFGSTGQIGLVDYGLGRNIGLNVPCKNFSLTIPAENAECWSHAYIVDTRLNAISQPIVAEATQESIYSQFEKSLLPLRGSHLMTIGPSELKYGSPSPGMLDEKLDKALRDGTETILVTAEYDWRDGMGAHVNQACAWLQVGPPSGLFSGPGVLTPNINPVWNYCKQHNGIKPKSPKNEAAKETH